MPIDIQRFLIQVIPYVACSTIAALIIWEEDVKSILRPLIVFILLSSAIQAATYIINIESIRFPLEVLSGFAIALLVFKKPLIWITRIFITSYVLGIITVSFTVMLLLAVNSFGLSEMRESVIDWLKVGAISNPAMLGIALLILRGKIPVKKFYSPTGIQLRKLVQIFLGIFIQMTIFISLETDLIKQSGLINPGLRFLIYSALYGLSIFLFIRFVQISMQTAGKSVQEDLALNIQEMLYSLRGQRHDFNNHLHVINTLCQQKDIEALEEYTGDLLKETWQYNELLKIDNPILSALINTKINQANEHGISVDLDIQTSLSDLGHISLELSRILGNLFDNAVDELENSTREKIIFLRIVEKGPLLAISVGNSWDGDKFIIEKAFKNSFSTKSKTDHQGLGLQICRQLAKKIHAGFEYSYDSNGIINFNLSIPKK